MSHKFLQTKGNGRKFTQNLAVFARRGVTIMVSCNMWGQSENVLFELIGNTVKR